MKVKRFLSLFLALVMSLALAVPTLAAELPPELGTVQSADADAPRYAVYTAPVTVDMENNTYCDLTFLMAEKNGTYYFEKLDSISFRTTNPNGSHWRVEEYDYTISADSFSLWVACIDVEGNTPSSSAYYDFYYSATPQMIMGYSRSDADGNYVKLSPVNVRYMGENENISWRIHDESVSWRFHVEY